MTRHRTPLNAADQKDGHMDWQLLRDTLTLNAHVDGLAPEQESQATRIAKAKLDGGARTMAAGILELIELGETKYVVAVLERTVRMMVEAIAQLAGMSNTKGQLLIHSEGSWPLDSSAPISQVGEKARAW